MANTIVLRKGARIGQPDAESDGEFLSACFLNNGSFDHLTDISSKQCILLGRAGSGKSALIKELKKRHENVIVISPDILALNNLANSEVIGFFEEAGVHLDGFYILLWKHIISVELLKKRYKIYDEIGQRKFLSIIAEIGRKDRNKEQAVKYLQEWGEKFW